MDGWMVCAGRCAARLVGNAPDIAFVTLMRGEWRAGATPQTALYPIMDARANVKALPIKRGPVAFPSATAAVIPPVTTATSRDFC